MNGLHTLFFHRGIFVNKLFQTFFMQLFLIYLGFCGLFNKNILFHLCKAIWISFNISICLFLFFTKFISFCLYLGRLFWLHLSTGIYEFLNICVSWCWEEAYFLSLYTCLNHNFFIHLSTRITISFNLCVCLFLYLNSILQFGAVHRKINELYFIGLNLSWSKSNLDGLYFKIFCF